MAQASLDQAYFCMECFQYFETSKEFEIHNYQHHQPEFGNGMVKKTIQICFKCAEQLSKAVKLRSDGSSILVLHLCKNCTSENYGLAT